MSSQFTFQFEAFNKGQAQFKGHGEAEWQHAEITESQQHLRSWGEQDQHSRWEQWETCSGKQLWRSKGSQVTDNAGSSNMKCELSAWNNNVTVNKKHFARCQAEEEVLAEAVEAVTEVEVQVGLQIKNVTMMSQQMTKMTKWSLHHTAQERNRVQPMMQSRRRMTSDRNVNMGMI